MSDKVTVLDTRKVKDFLKNLSLQDFKNFGVEQIAYIRSDDEHSESYAVYAADGELLSRIATRDKALIAAREHDLQPVTVH